MYRKRVSATRTETRLRSSVSARPATKRESKNTIVDGDIGVEPGAPCRNHWKKNEFVTEIGPMNCIGAPKELDEDDVCGLDDDDDDDEDDDEDDDD